MPLRTRHEFSFDFQALASKLGHRMSFLFGWFYNVLPETLVLASDFAECSLQDFLSSGWMWALLLSSSEEACVFALLQALH